MKYPISFAVVASALLASSLAFSAAPQNPDAVQQRLDAMQRDILDSRSRMEQAIEELKGTRKTIEEAQKYIEAQAKSAKAMAAVLDESEKQGFTYGINAGSREVLLAGWREQLGQLQEGVPAPLPQPKDPKDSKDTKKTEEKKP
jgi:septal ring factor EnvC (AmiA/AmiB activator)